jgi:hypothetical protein
VLAKYLIGLLTIVFSLAGLYLRLSGQLPRTSPALDLARLSVVAWLAIVFACGWLGASSQIDARNGDSRLLSGILAVLMLPVTAVLTVAGILVPLAQGNPHTFQVIRKTQGGSR